jgi:hypothetical protein
MQIFEKAKEGEEELAADLLAALAGGRNSAGEFPK